jgi:PHS family inorganic phosphate transporter-like MFS transporter
VLEAAGFGDRSHLATVARGAAVVAAIALPGYAVGFLLIERTGRRALQIGGFLLVGVTFFAMAGTLRDLERIGGLFLFVYGLTFLFANLGPNLTTYVVPSELFPTRVRATCHGISAASGKIGAIVGGAALEPVLSAYGLSSVLLACGIISVVGAAWSWAFVEDMSGLDLEETDEDPDAKSITDHLEHDWWRRAPVVNLIRHLYTNRVAGGEGTRLLHAEPVQGPTTR